jgi:IS30 family transposase
MSVIITEDRIKKILSNREKMLNDINKKMVLLFREVSRSDMGVFMDELIAEKSISAAHNSLLPGPKGGKKKDLSDLIIKLEKDREIRRKELANYIEEKIADDGYSPEAALLDIKRKNLNFSVTITKQTLYKYIYDGIFMRVTADNLAIKRKRKSYHKIQRKAKRAAAGTSIEHRPVDIDTREEFGHWEMDSVMGQQGKSKNALVVLTERKTRYEKIFKVKDHTAASVVKCINSLERKWGRLFSDIFKTITVDNGTEFADCDGIEKKDKKGKKRTEVYYCHPYCSAERGSNENQNRMIRRHIPKGTNFDRKTKKDIQKVEDWLNNYPRPMFGGRSSQELYEEEMRLII